MSSNLFFFLYNKCSIKHFVIVYPEPEDRYENSRKCITFNEISESFHGLEIQDNLTNLKIKKGGGNCIQDIIRSKIA